MMHHQLDRFRQQHAELAYTIWQAYMKLNACQIMLSLFGAYRLLMRPLFNCWANGIWKFA